MVRHCRFDTLMEDAMIAATTVVHGLTVVTPNMRDLDQLGVDVLSSFECMTELRR